MLGIGRLFSGKSGDQAPRFGGHDFAVHHPLFTQLHGLWRLIGEKHPGIEAADDGKAVFFEMMLPTSFRAPEIAAYAVRKIEQGLDALDCADIEHASLCFEAAKHVAWAAGVGTLGCFNRIDHNTGRHDDF